MKIAIGNDHHGVKRKKEIMEYLQKMGNIVVNEGTDTKDLVDFPNYAFKVAKLVKDNEVDLGILLCGTGIGMSIAANKVKGIRCAKIDNINDARLSRQHNNANVLAMSSTLNLLKVKRMLNAFLNSVPNKEERYQKRNDMIDRYSEE